jgi:hypothetical protein
MPSINRLSNYNLATSVDSRGGQVNQRNLFFYGNRGSYSSGSATWFDLSGNANNAAVSGSTLVPTGSLGYVFNGVNNSLYWANGGFTTGSCVDGGFTIQMTMQPDPADVLTSPYNTTALWNNISNTGPSGSGFSGIYFNDGDIDGAFVIPGPTQAMQGNVNFERNLYIYGQPEFIQGTRNVAWSFFPTTLGLTGSMQFDYYVPEFQRERYTNGDNVAFMGGITPTVNFGTNVYNQTPLAPIWTYFPYKGIVRDILIYNRALSKEEIYKNYLALNAINASF